jgi:hypothetical protein
MDKPPTTPVVTPHQAAVFTDSTSGPLTVHYTRRTLKMHTISEVELDTVAALGNSIHLALLGIGAGTFITCVITLLTVSISDPRTAAIFVGLTWISGVASLYFGARSASDYLAARRKLKEIKEGKI